MMEKALLQVEEVTKRFGGLTAVIRFRCTLNRGRR